MMISSVLIFYYNFNFGNNTTKRFTTGTSAIIGACVALIFGVVILMMFLDVTNIVWGCNFGIY